MFSFPIFSPVFNGKDKQFINNAVPIPIVVSNILSKANWTGLISFSCVTVTQRKTTHIKNVPCVCLRNTDNLIIGISIRANTRWRKISD